MLTVKETALPGVLIIEPDVFQDTRGYFMETYHRGKYADNGLKQTFVQDNISYSQRGALRGLHYQHPHAQGKLVQAVRGRIFDVAVDIRRGSPTFGRWTGEYLSDRNNRQLFVPGGFAHGFCVVSEDALVMYKCTDLYAPECEGGVLWSDPDIGIDWPVAEPLLSEKDARYPYLRDIPPATLPPLADHL